MTKETFIYGLNACAVTYHNGQKFYEHDELVECFEDLGMFEQEPFMNKPCVAHQVCHEDKVKVLEQIKAEIEDLVFDYSDDYHLGYNLGLIRATQVIDKYKAESEDKE